MSTKLLHGSAEQLQVLNERAGTPTFTVGVEASNHIDVTIQLKDLKAVAVAVKTKVCVWLSDTAGVAPSGTAPNGATSFTTGILLKEVTTKLLWDVLSDATGALVLRITETGTPTFFVNVAIGTAIYSSTACTFA